MLEIDSVLYMEAIMTQSSDKEVGTQGAGQSGQVNQPSHTEGKSVESEHAHLGQGGGGGAGRLAEEGSLGNKTDNTSNGQESSGG